MATEKLQRDCERTKELENYRIIHCSKVEQSICKYYGMLQDYTRNGKHKIRKNVLE